MHHHDPTHYNFLPRGTFDEPPRRSRWWWFALALVAAGLAFAFGLPVVW